MAEETEVVTIVDLAVDGAGIARLKDDCVVFVDQALPGDVVRVRPLRRNRRLAFAQLVELITPSPGRSPSRCDLWRCGGCPIKGSDSSLQAHYKVERVRAALQRVAKLAPEQVVAPMLSAGDGWAYRHRIRLHAAWRAIEGEPRGGRFVLGYHERRSHSLVPLSTCPVAWPEVERLGRAVAGGVAQLPREARPVAIELVYSRLDGRGSAAIAAEGPIAAFRQSLTWLEESSLSGLEVTGSDGSFRWGNMELRYDHGQKDAFDLRFEAGQFTQAHVAANDLLVAEVLDCVQPSAGLNVLELHAGIGNFTVPLGRLGARMTAVESARRSAIFLQRNAEAAGVACDVHVGRDDEMLHLLKRRPDVVVLDPPRTGARALAARLAALEGLRPRRIVYTSCDPATFARDAGILVAGGYRLQRVQPIDLFSQTPHVECVGLFVSP